MKSLKRRIIWLVSIAVILVSGFLVVLLFWFVNSGHGLNHFSVKITAAADNIPNFDLRIGRMTLLGTKFTNEFFMTTFNVCKVDENGKRLITYWEIKILNDDDLPHFIYHKSDSARSAILDFSNVTEAPTPQKTPEQISVIQEKYYPSQIKYGTAPPGWTQETAPRSLDDGLYSIDDLIFFAKKGNSYTVLPQHHNKEELVDYLKQANRVMSQ